MENTQIDEREKIENLINMTTESATTQDANKLVEKLSQLWIKTNGKIDEYVLTDILSKVAAIGNTSTVPFLTKFDAVVHNSLSTDDGHDVLANMTIVLFDLYDNINLAITACKQRPAQ